MNCQRVRELLPQYLDQDLEGRDMAMVREHLEGCPACRERLDLNRRLMVELAEQPPFAEEAEAGARVRRRVMEAVAQYQSWGPLWRALGTAGNAAGWITVSVLLVTLVAGLAISGRPLLEGPLSPATATATATPTVSETPPEPSPTATATHEPSPTPTAEAPPSQPPTLPPASPTPAPTADVLPIMQGYGHDGLGIAVEYPLSWTVATGSSIATDGRYEEWAAFSSDYYAGGSQAYGRYSIRVAVRHATTETVAGAVEAWLRPMPPEVRDQIEQRQMVLGGEDAIEVGPLPGQRFGAHMVVAMHEDREYRLTFSPDPAFGTPYDAEARAVFATFLRDFAFMPVAQVAPTPTPGPGLSGPVIGSLIVTPDERRALYAVADSRLYRSADGGQSWLEEDTAGLAPETDLTGVTIDYRHPSTMYLLTNRGIYRRQGGDAWELVSTLNVRALAVDMVDPSVLWAGVLRTPDQGAVMLKSSDGGRSWTATDLAADSPPWASWTSDILVDPTNPDILWAVVRSWRSDVGQTGTLFRGNRDGQWERVSLRQFDPAFDNPDGCEVAGIAYDPNANLLYAGCERSTYNHGRLLLIRSPNADAAALGDIRWEVARYYSLPESPCTGWYEPGIVRPLAVDAQAPRSLYLSTTILGCAEEALLGRRHLLVSHDDGATYEVLKAPGLP